MKEEASFINGVDVSMRRWAVRDLSLESLKWRGRSLHRGCVSGITFGTREHKMKGLDRVVLSDGLCWDSFLVFLVTCLILKDEVF